MQINIKNLSMKTELMLSEESNNFVLEYIDWGVVEGSHGATSNTDTVGEIVTSTFLLPRDITIIGWVLGPGEGQIKARKNVLNKLINPQSDMVLEYKGFKLKVKAERTVKYGTRYQENNEKMCKFIINLRAHQPLFLLKEELVKAQIGIKSTFVFPSIFNPTIIFGAYPEQSISNMLNLGDVYTGFVIRLIAIGTAKNPMLKNTITQEYIKLNFDVLLGDAIEISTVNNNKYIELIRTEERSNIIGKLERGSTLFGMLPGVNSFELLADENANNLDVEFEYVPRFLEVQD